uniref:Uncharacterized protein n=1 Tax=Alexandrium monilatum TaxID=311494 RepID=A0A7S4VA90_9DINO
MADTEQSSPSADEHAAFRQQEGGAREAKPAEPKAPPDPPRPGGEDVGTAPPKKEPSQMSAASEKILLARRVFQVSKTVRAGGALLALCAGMVNAVAFKHLGSFVSHATGTATKIGLGLQDSSVADAGESALLVLSFVCGSTVCGLLIGKNTIHFGLALYDFCLLGVSALLVATGLLADRPSAKFLAASACGLQNGMATIWGGAVIRTTHVTGLVTDVGLLIGRLTSIFLRKRCGRAFDVVDTAEVADDVSKLTVLLTLGTAFFLGAVAGAQLEESIGEYAFFVPAGVTGSIGIAYSAYRVLVLHQRFFSVEEMEAVDLPAEVFEGDAGSTDGAVGAASAPRSRAASYDDDLLLSYCTHAHQMEPVFTVPRGALLEEGRQRSGTY